MTPADPTLRDRVAAVLHGNRVRAARGRYTRPARATYPHQWLWDSCFHAIVYDLLGDNGYARDELRALFRAQVAGGPDRGRLPHMTLMGADPDEAAQDPDGAAAYARDVALWGDPCASSITQPPVVAEAVLRVGDAGFYRELWPGLAGYYDWWLRRRDPDGDHLYSAWHVWECGADATPRADEPALALCATGRAPRALDKGTVNPTAKKRQDLLAARFLMLEDLQAIDADEAAGRATEAASQRRREALFGHEAVDMQAFLVRNLRDLATIGEAIGEAAAARRYRAESDAICAAVNARLWDDDAGFYFDRFGPDERVARVLTPAALVALYAGDLVPLARAERLLGHLLDPRTFWTRWPLPTVARSDPRFEPDEYWRGSSWVNVNWFVVRGLVTTAERAGGDGRYLAAARALAERTVAMVERAGLREYYRSGARDPADDAALDGPAGFGPEAFGWSALALDLATMLEKAPLVGVEAAR